MLGGSFSEGIDLPGERLIGVICVGVGLPGLSNENNIIREYYDEKNLSGSVAIFIGNEAKGLSKEISMMADRLIKIPMEGQLESLNASVAAAILIYEAKRKNS